MIKDSNNFWIKQNLIQVLMKNYREDLSMKMYNQGYILIERNDYLLISAKKQSSLISLPGFGRKIYYGNIMPESLDKLIPLNDKPIDKRTIREIGYKLEKIATEMSLPAVADFSFENGLSLSILGKKFHYEPEEFSIHIPMKTFDSKESLIDKLEECIITNKKRKLFF